MSDSERPDLLALAELQRVLHALGEEMTALRRRAQAAEARVRELEGATSQLAFAPSPGLAAGEGNAAGLARENEQLRARLETARVRTRSLLDRVRFLRQQAETGVER